MTQNRPKSTPDSPQPGSVATLVALGKACGVSAKTAGAWSRMPGFPVAAGGDGKPRYSPFIVGIWHATEGPGRPKQLPDVPIEPGMEGPPSPALERWRIARAIGAEMDLAERRKRLLSRDDVHRFHVLIATFLASHGEQLQRDGDMDAFHSWEDVLANIEGCTEAFFASQFEGSWTHQQGRYLVTIVDTLPTDSNPRLEEMQ